MMLTDYGCPTKGCGWNSGQWRWEWVCLVLAFIHSYTKHRGDPNHKWRRRK